MQSTEEPGADSDFWIRGVSTFGANNRPLVLVDGIERSLDLVDPENVRSFSILNNAPREHSFAIGGLKARYVKLVITEAFMRLPF